MSDESLGERSVVRAIVAGHGSFSSGVISAVHQITGMGELFLPVSNSDLGADGIYRMLDEALASSAARVVFTDLPAGSCTIAVRRLLARHPGVLLVTGCNVPLLLDFAMQDSADSVQAAMASLERAKAAMMVFGGDS